MCLFKKFLFLTFSCFFVVNADVITKAYEFSFGDFDYVDWYEGSNYGWDFDVADDFVTSTISKSTLSLKFELEYTQMTNYLYIDYNLRVVPSVFLEPTEPLPFAFTGVYQNSALLNSLKDDGQVHLSLTAKNMGLAGTPYSTKYGKFLGAILTVTGEQVVAVPEPATISLLIAGLCMLPLLSLRKKKSF